MLPPRNGGEPLQAANAVGMADRIIYLCNVVDFDKKVISDDFIEAPSGEATSEEKLEFNVSAHGTIPDSPSMIMYSPHSYYTFIKLDDIFCSDHNIYHQIMDMVWSW
ncbi:hypothetical protein ACHAXS_004537 [Conticribra weissflogii]